MDAYKTPYSLERYFVIAYALTMSVELYIPSVAASTQVPTYQLHPTVCRFRYQNQCSNFGKRIPGRGKHNLFTTYGHVVEHVGRETFHVIGPGVIRMIKH